MAVEIPPWLDPAETLLFAAGCIKSGRVKFCPPTIARTPGRRIVGLEYGVLQPRFVESGVPAIEIGDLETGVLRPACLRITVEQRARVGAWPTPGPHGDGPVLDILTDQ